MEENEREMGRRKSKIGTDKGEMQRVEEERE